MAAETQQTIHLIPSEDCQHSSELSPVVASAESMLDTFLEAGECLRDVGSFVIRKEAIDLNKALIAKKRARDEEESSSSKKICSDDDDDDNRRLGARATRTKRMSQLLRTIETAHQEFATEMKALMEQQERPSSS